jgi:hypothetical protein
MKLEFDIRNNYRREVFDLEYQHKKLQFHGFLDFEIIFSSWDEMYNFMQLIIKNTSSEKKHSYVEILREKKLEDDVVEFDINKIDINNGLFFSNIIKIEFTNKDVHYLKQMIKEYDILKKVEEKNK